MKTIVEYRDDIEPYENYPYGIVSPTKSSKCCMLHMVKVGAIVSEERLSGAYNTTLSVTSYQYKRCVVCGFTVCRIVKDGLSDREIEKIQELFNSSAMTRRWEE